MTQNVQYSPEVASWLDKARSRERPYGAAPIGHGLWLFSAVTERTDFSAIDGHIRRKGYLWVKIVNPTVRQPPDLLIQAQCIEESRIAWLEPEVQNGGAIIQKRPCPCINRDDPFAAEDDFSVAFGIVSKGICTIVSCAVQGMTKSASAKSTFTIDDPQFSAPPALLPENPYISTLSGASVSQPNKTPAKPVTSMLKQHHNSRRAIELSELLDIEYEKCFSIEKAVAMSSGNERISLELQFKRDLVPKIRELESEYDNYLLDALQKVAIPEEAASAVLERISNIINDVSSQLPADAPSELIAHINRVQQTLSTTEVTSTAKLKITIPIIPAICAYEMEVNAVKVIRNAWHVALRLLQRFL